MVSPPIKLEIFSFNSDESASSISAQRVSIFLYSGLLEDRSARLRLPLREADALGGLPMLLLLGTTGVGFDIIVYLGHHPFLRMKLRSLGPTSQKLEFCEKDNEDLGPPQ